MFDQFEAMIQQLASLCSWMSEDDVVLLRQSFSYLHETASDEENLDTMGAANLQLEERARLAGDERRAWMFGQLYQEVCAWKQGQEYIWPDMPEHLQD